MSKFNSVLQLRKKGTTVLLIIGFTLLVSCDFLVHDQVPAEKRDNPSVPGPGPAPESFAVASACEALGYELGRPDMDIGAGQSYIQLPARANRIEIDSAPAALDQADTEYVLTQDVSAPQTAFEIFAHNVTLNLNGHRITYGTADSPSVAFPDGTAGVKIRYARTGIVVANGEIVQGNGDCTGDSSGRNCNPVMATGGAATIEIGGLELAYHTTDTNGIVAPANVEIHHNTFIDTGSEVTYAPNGVAAILMSTGTAHHNRILSTRHRGIKIGNGSEVSYNEIHVNSYYVNSYGVMAYKIQGFSIHHNKIYGTGVHPIGIGPVASGGTDGQVYSNYVITENTRTGNTTGSAAFRITTYGGWCDRIEAMCNYFVAKGGNPHPELHENSWGRALWIGGLEAGNTADLHHNYIEARTNDAGKYHVAVAVVSGGYNDGLYVQDNTVVANHTMVALLDGYGGAGAGYPKFFRNRFVRKDNHAVYRTIADKNHEYTHVTGLFLDNAYEDGAELSDDTIELLYHCTSSKTEVGVGRMVNDVPQLEYYLTDDPARVASGSSSEPFGNCGFRVVP